MTATIQIAQQPEADDLLARSPLALLIGALLDQQVPMEWAFTGPYTLLQRLGGADLDASRIADYDPDEFAAIMSDKPAVHRYPGSMASRVQKLCQYLVDHYDAKPAAVWEDVDDGDQLLKRLQRLPGFGEQKARVFVAILGKRYHVTPKNWREAAGDYGQEGVHLSAADVTGPDSLATVRATKKDAKRAKKDT